METKINDLKGFNVLSPDEMKGIVAGSIYCMGIMYNSIVVTGLCSGDIATECIQYAYDMGMTNVTCQYGRPYPQE